MLLIIDNYDSFTYNLVQYFWEFENNIKVIRNDKITVSEIKILNPKAIVISPGPCTPNEAGISLEIVNKLHTYYPILGICLGHQTIAQAFGAKIIKAAAPVHGKRSAIVHNNQGLFQHLKNPLNVTRYHSLLVSKENFPDCLEITAQTSNGEIMGLRHKKYLVSGVQFHPEAILSEQGKELLQNFITMLNNFER